MSQLELDSKQVMITPRPYQIDCLSAIEESRAEGINRQLIHLPTASGKTVIFALLIDQAIKLDPSTRVIVLAFSRDLLEQARDKILMINPSLEVGIVDGSNKDFDKQIVISSVQSARQPGNLERLKKRGFSIAVCDECHHFVSDSAKLVLNELGFSKGLCHQNNRLLLGFSATPFRQDSRGLGEVFDKIVFHRSIKSMIEDGYLCKPIGAKVITDIDFSKVLIENGDFSSIGLSNLMDTEEVNTTVVKSFIEKANGRRTIAFTTSISHAKSLSDCFRRAGISSEAIHCKLPIAEKDSLKRQFKEGSIEVLTNPMMLCEGYDEPSISCVIVARPTKSPGLYQQMAGRSLRLFPNKKDCLILDFSDQNHSLCNIGVLLEDNPEDDETLYEKKEASIPCPQGVIPNINQKLQKAILDIDLLGEAFTWKKDPYGRFYLKGTGAIILTIVKQSEDRYRVIFTDSRGRKEISEGLNFEYSFSAAEDFAKANRSLFVMSDIEASWRSLPISEKQKELFAKNRFKKGIDNLTRGQAAEIIGSGILFKRSKRNSKVK